MTRPRAFDTDAALTAALTTFWEKGYSGSSIQVLLDTMQLNRGSLYASFGGKDALFKASLDLYQRRVVQVVINLLEQDPSPTHGIYAVFDLTLAALPESQRRKGCLLVNTVAELGDVHPELAQHAARLLDTVRAVMKRTLQRAITCGEWVRPDADPDMATDLLFNFLTGLRVTSRAQSNPARVRQSVRHMLTLIGLPIGEVAL